MCPLDSGVFAGIHKVRASSPNGGRGAQRRSINTLLNGVNWSLPVRKRATDGERPTLFYFLLYHKNIYRRQAESFFLFFQITFLILYQKTLFPSLSFINNIIIISSFSNLFP
jgi:hypothetical protein